MNRQNIISNIVVEGYKPQDFSFLTAVRISTTPERILSLISNNPYVTKNEMASTLNLSVPAISKQFILFQ